MDKMKGGKAPIQDKEKTREAEVRALELRIFKDFHRIMPETSRIADISSQKWHEQTLALLDLLGETAKNRNLEIIALCKKEKITARQILAWVKKNNDETTLYQKGAAQIIAKHNRILLNSEPYKFFKKEIFLMSTKELMNSLITTIEANAFFRHYVPFITERLDKIHLEVSAFEERDRREVSEVKNLVKHMLEEGAGFSEKLERSKNVIANQLSLHFLRERLFMAFGKKSLEALIIKLERGRDLEIEELLFIRKFRRIQEMFARHDLRIYMLNEKGQQVLYTIQNTLVRGMLETPGAKVGF